MKLSEYKNTLEKQIDILEQAQKEAIDGDFYGDVVELSKQINNIGLRLVQIEVHRNESG